MTTINRQIDAAIPLMKARGAKFNETKTMDGVTALRLVGLAHQNLRNVHGNLYDCHRFLGLPALDVDDARRDLLDTMNLCALALSVLPKGGSNEPT